MGALIDNIDWSTTSLGAPGSWPRSLRAIIETILDSRQPMFLWWGPDLIQFYNDAYVPSFGVGKHPAAMGQRGADCWAEIWPIIGPQIDDVMRHRRASWHEDQLVPIFRNGRIEEVYWTYGYSPILDDDGRVGGTLVVCTETTSRVILERRLEILRRFSLALSSCDDVKGILGQALPVLAEAQGDVPFALLYPANSSGLGSALPVSLCPDAAVLPLLDAAVRSFLGSSSSPESEPIRQLPLPEGLAAFGPSGDRVESFVVLSPRAPQAGRLVIGLSPRLPFDPAYQRFLFDFLELANVAGQRVEAFLVRAAVESERRNLLLQAPVATAIMTGPRHVFELANSRYVQMVGREVLGMAYVEAFPEIAGTPLADVVDRVYQKGEPFVAAEYWVPLATNGGALEDRFFKFNLEPLRDAAGKVYAMMAVAVDITEVVTARRAGERTVADRERLVAELEGANRAKDAFLATVSHELRTPLSAILGWSRMLASGKVAPDKLPHALAVIERNASAQAQLIEDLLDVSRIVSGKLRLEIGLVSLATIAEAAIESVHHAIQAKGIQFEAVIDPAVGSIMGDTHRLQQVIWNLLSNAVKFTPTGGLLQLAIARTDANVQIAVADTGQGLPPHLLGSVFDRFQQADGSSSRVHGGLGLGLAISRHIVELHGGQIDAESEGEGRGATFTVTFPSGPLPGDVDGVFRHSPASTRFASRRTPPELQGLTVLVVDDEADSRELIVELLRQQGISVLPAASAADGLVMLDRASPRVLVSDIAMPGMDGYTFIETVRRRPADKGGSIAALALTAYAGIEDRRRALLAGFQMHLAKPVEPVDLLAAITALARLATVPTMM